MQKIIKILLNAEKNQKEDIKMVAREKETIDRNKQSKTNYAKYCGNCGHTISFYAFEPKKKVCNWCGVTNYKSRIDEFKDLLQRQMKEV